MCRPRNTQVTMQFGENVLERRRRWNTDRNGKAQPVGLSWAMIGVLPQDHHLHLVERCQLKSPEDVAAFGMDGVPLALADQERLEVLERGCVQGPPKALGPAIANIRGAGCVVRLSVLLHGSKDRRSGC